MNESDIRARLAELRLPEGEYVLHASASLVLRGILERAGDVDIVAKGPAWEWALARVEAGEATLDRGEYDQRVSLGDVEVYDGWLGETAEAVIARAEPVGGVPCAPLQAVKAMKERLGRPKDGRHLELIRRAAPELWEADP